MLSGFSFEHGFISLAASSSKKADSLSRNPGIFSQVKKDNAFTFESQNLLSIILWLSINSITIPSVSVLPDSILIAAIGQLLFWDSYFYFQ